MTIRDSIRLASSAIRGGILRTMLTILSLAVGVASVLTVRALGAAGELRVEDEIGKLGVNKVWIRPVSGRSTLSEQDARMISKNVHAPACAGAYTMTTIMHDREPALVQVTGFDASANAVHAPQLLDGRMIRLEEYQTGATVCLIDEVLEQHFGHKMPLP